MRLEWYGKSRKTKMGPKYRNLLKLYQKRQDTEQLLYTAQTTKCRDENKMLFDRVTWNVVHAKTRKANVVEHQFLTDQLSIILMSLSL